MSDEDKKVYTEFTIKMYFEKDIQKQLEVYSPDKITAFINKFWDMKDPLFLTEENERLAEHYYRVAYSNYFFSSKELKIPGWKLDRGKVFISFGEPMSMRTDKVSRLDDRNNEVVSYPYLWVYPDGTVIQFETLGKYNYYWISRLDAPPYGPGLYPLKMETSGDRYQDNKYGKFASSELKSNKQYITPMQLNVFKSFTSTSLNNVYFTYLMPMPNSSYKEEHNYLLIIHNDSLGYESKKAGFVKKDFIDKIEKEKRPAYEKLNTLTTDIKSGKRNFAFETMTSGKDTMVSSLHREYEFPAFKKDALDMSGLLIASKVSDSSPILGAINRNNVYILPRIGRRYKNTDPLYLYYEVYNLVKQADGKTDFEHTITIKETEPDEAGIPIQKIFKDLSGFVTGKSDKVSLTTAYKTQEKDSQVYIQFDISKYKPGKYDLSIIVLDKISGEKVEREWQFEIVDSQNTN